jgi:hypothetical protein
MFGKELAGVNIFPVSALHIIAPLPGILTCNQ